MVFAKKVTKLALANFFAWTNFHSGRFPCVFIRNVIAVQQFGNIAVMVNGFRWNGLITKNSPLMEVDRLRRIHVFSD